MKKNLNGIGGENRKSVFPVDASFWLTFFEAPLLMVMKSQAYCFCLEDEKTQVILIVPDAQATSLLPNLKIIDEFSGEKGQDLRVHQFNKDPEILSIIEPLRRVVGVECSSYRQDGKDVFVLAPDWKDELGRDEDSRLMAFDRFGVSLDSFNGLKRESDDHKLFFASFSEEDQRLILMGLFNLTDKEYEIAPGVVVNVDRQTVAVLRRDLHVVEDPVLH